MDPILEAAKIIAASRRNRAALKVLPGEVAPSDEADGYRIQRAVHDLMLPSTGALVGYKIGCTSKVMQEYLDIPHPCGGGVFASGVYDSGVRLHAADFVRVGVECEIARKADRNLALDTHAHEIGHSQADAGFMDATCEHAAAAWMWNVEIFLHDLAGAADLIADQRTRAR